MYFYFGDHNVTVLFEGWNINSVGGKSVIVVSLEDL